MRSVRTHTVSQQKCSHPQLWKCPILTRSVVVWNWWCSVLGRGQGGGLLLNFLAYELKGNWPKYHFFKMRINFAPTITCSGIYAKSACHKISEEAYGSFMPNNEVSVATWIPTEGNQLSNFLQYVGMCPVFIEIEVSLYKLQKPYFQVKIKNKQTKTAMTWCRRVYQIKHKGLTCWPHRENLGKDKQLKRLHLHCSTGRKFTFTILFAIWSFCFNYSFYHVHVFIFALNEIKS